MGSDYYRLLPDGSAESIGRDCIAWSKEFEDRDKRRIALTEFRGRTISTVFLGMDHRFDDGPPLIFETMIFGGPFDEYQWRYSTKQDAEAGHAYAVKVARIPTWAAWVLRKLGWSPKE